MTALFLALLFCPDGAATVRAGWLADLHPDHVQPGPGRFVFVPGSAADEVDPCVVIEASGRRAADRIQPSARHR